MYAGYDNKLVYLLDLCTLSYHLHSQTLIWPMDPYFEQMAKTTGTRRDTIMKRVREDADEQFSGEEENANGLTVPKYSGPGSFSGSNGWQTDNSLDPIVSQYSRINPWQPGFTREKPGNWTVYKTPKQITDRINDVYIARYSGDNGYESVTPGQLLQTIHLSRPPDTYTQPATDSLYCFEGNTGAISAGSVKPGAWSMMGFVLVEHDDPNNPNVPYDVYITFRGSRSGSANRAATQGLVGKTGNPDWVTDMDFRVQKDDPLISVVGQVCRGFSTSIHRILPNIMRCLCEIQNRKGKPPRYIYVTGHSLGGALACHFASAMTLGNLTRLKQTDFLSSNAQSVVTISTTWPWHALELVTFGGPVVGDTKFQQAFDLQVNCKRMWVNGDPVTQSAVRNHVGLPYRISRWDIARWTTRTGTGGTKQDTAKMVADPASHEPYLIRRDLIRELDYLGMGRRNIPAASDVITSDGKPLPKGTYTNSEPWLYRKNLADTMAMLNPERLYLPNFTADVIKYFRIMNEPKLNPIIELDDTTEATTIESRIIATWSGILEDSSFTTRWSDDIKQFVGLCLVLIAISKEITLPQNDDFSDLLTWK